MLEEYVVEGRTFTKEETGLVGINSGRPRFKVTCKECGAVVHEATTGPVPIAKNHRCNGG